ncbi:nucleoside triphosphate pyrophosphatase [Leptospira sp. GIMC2001]|uniref:nucleoside triphosphate pyrophosphatase n=1 Tax=Leptospira sp. GIMC2001 TaxID=1513297 RepID=UPI00234AB686|nr:nucleoside triphosphate pyrophosphatase [Leptospira sp. GIMC2001]WCL49533.1 Maf family protein [Leptospira sp. GIMC2001]
MIVLCSKSPRRIDILKNLGLSFQICPAEINEESMINESPLEYLERISKSKCLVGKNIFSSLHSLNISDYIFIASDTIVVLDNKILHKPINQDDAEDILSNVSGRVHSVHSSVVLSKNEKIYYDFDTTVIQAKDWNLKEIREYIALFKPFDKAGAYGIQDANSPVLSYEGSYSNVLGFPIRKFYQYIDVWN